MTILDLQPDAADGKDTYVHLSFPNDNFGTATFMLSRKNAPPPDTISSLIEFDLSSIPGGSTINSADLTLFNQLSAGGQLFGSRRISSTWTEGGVTWNTRPSEGTTYTVVAAISGPGLVTLDVSEFLIEIVEDGLTNFGIFLRPITSSFTFQWKTSDNATAGDRPRLVVDYTEPPPGGGGGGPGVSTKIVTLFP